MNSFIEMNHGYSNLRNAAHYVRLIVDQKPPNATMLALNMEEGMQSSRFPYSIIGQRPHDMFIGQNSYRGIQSKPDQQFYVGWF